MFLSVSKSINEANKSLILDEENEADDNYNRDESFNDSIQIDDQFQFEKYNCFHLFKKYIKEIYVRKKQFKDELLAAALEFFLALPKELVMVNLNEVFESLEVNIYIYCFNLFKTYFLIRSIQTEFT